MIRHVIQVGTGAKKTTNVRVDQQKKRTEDSQESSRKKLDKKRKERLEVQ